MFLVGYEKKGENNDQGINWRIDCTMKATEKNGVNNNFIVD